jgi:CHAT domain-containing protein/predicted negative regulator of RcsB-dependent stress response
MEREIRGGESHNFRVRLVAGQFLYVAVEQRGVDVAVAVSGPDGRNIVKVDSPNGTRGVEPVVLIAEASGNHRLVVSVPAKQAAAGKYDIKVLRLRPAEAVDKEHVIASRAFEEARQTLLPQRTATARRAAIEKYQQALAYFQTAGDRYRAALTLNEIGQCYAVLGEYRQAGVYFSQALQLYQELGDRYLEASGVNNLGRLYDVLGEQERAINYLVRGLELAREQKDRSSEASILNNIGKLYFNLADWQRALEYYRESLPLYQSLGDQRRLGIAYQNIGIAYTFLGDQDRAMEHLSKALELRQSANDKAGEAETLCDIGLIQSRQGRTQEALSKYQQSLLLYRAVGDRLGEGMTQLYSGITYLTIGDPGRARENLEQSLTLFRAVGDRRFEAITTKYLGQAFAVQGDAEQAQSLYSTALTSFRELGARQNEAQTLQGLALLDRNRGRLDDARGHLETALTLFEDVRSGVGSSQLRSFYMATRQDAYQLYIDLLMQSHRAQPAAGYDALALQASERARARSLLESLTETKVDIRQGVDAKLIARERELAQQLNAKAERLTQRNTASQMEALKKEIGQLETDYDQVRTTIRKASPRYAAITQPQPLKLEEIQQQVLGPDVLLLEYALGDERSYLWAVTTDSITSYELPKRELIQKATVRVTELLTARSLRPRTETAQQRTRRIAEADAALPEAAKQLSDMILAPATDKLANRRLLIVPDGALQYLPFAMLPEPEREKEGTRESGTERKNATPVSPSLRLSIPLSPLVVSHEIITLPSASTLAVMRKELAGRQPAPKMLAIFADPVFASDDERRKSKTAPADSKSDSKAAPKSETPDTVAAGRMIVHEDAKAASGGIGGSKLLIPRLPFTRQEADRILATIPNSANLKAFDFTANRALATGTEIGQYRYLHFATHGMLDAEREGLSALVLSLVDEQGKPQDGFLRVHEIYNLNLPAELVVLSACQTGLGKEYKGEGLVGLTRGFMYAGAARVVVSLWNVNDRATSELMPRFYQKMLKEGQSPAAALRSSQVEMWRQKQWAAPYDWAAFVLQGEWK